MSEGLGLGKRKQVILPSELKRIQRAKRTENSNHEFASKFTQIPHAILAPSSLPKATPLQEISPNSCLPMVENDRSLNHTKVTWSLLTRLSLTVESEKAEWLEPLGTWNNILHRHSCGSIGQESKNLQSLAESLEFYRFPFSPLTHDSEIDLSKVLRSSCSTTTIRVNSIMNSIPKSISSGSDNVVGGTGHNMQTSYCRQIAQGWRRSLLSLYGRWRSNKIPYFYYLQSGLVILFYRQDAPSIISNGDSAIVMEPDTSSKIPTDNPDKQVIARVANAPITLIKAMRSEGVSYEMMGDHFNDVPDENNFEEDDELDSDVDSKTLRKNINSRINRTKITRTKSSAETSLTVKGEQSVHFLFDYIMNQKDGRSFVVLPELISPGPFLHGTLCRAEFNAVGPLAGSGQWQIEINKGVILPGLASSLLDVTKILGPGVKVHIHNLPSDADPRTSTFLDMFYT